jgi:hypothetical protein
MHSSLSTPIKKKGYIAIYLHIKKMCDWWPMWSQNSAKHLWLSVHVETNIQEEYLSLTIHEEPFLDKNTYNWLSMQNGYSKRIVMTDYPSGFNVQQRHW